MEFLWKLGARAVLAISALCVAGIACQLEEPGGGEVKASFGDSGAVIEKEISECVKEVFFSEEKTLSDGKTNRLARGGSDDGSRDYADGSREYTFDINNKIAIPGIDWSDDIPGDEDDRFSEIKTDADTCECLQRHGMTIGTNILGQVRVGLGEFSKQAPSDRWTVEGTVKNTNGEKIYMGMIRGTGEKLYASALRPTIEITRVPDLDGQDNPTYEYCRLKITVIPSEKAYPITEELELGGGKMHNEVTALVWPRVQYTGSEAN